MATFKVKIGAGDGSIAVRQIQGNSPEEVRRVLKGEGYFVFHIKRIFDLKSLFGFQRRVPARKFIVFNREFRGLIKAGLPIVESLDLILKRAKDKHLHPIVEAVRDKLTKGQSLSEAFADLPVALPRHYPALLHAGEQSGNLVEVLDRFIEGEERLRKGRKKFLQSMTYPVILLAVGLISMLIILTKALPEFAALYADTGKELPLATTVVNHISQFLLNYWQPLMAGCLIAGTACLLFLRTPYGRAAGERVLRHLPVAGKLWRLQNRNIFTRTMKLLIHGGVPVPQALAITAGAVPSASLGNELKTAHQKIQQGESLQAALANHTHLEPGALEMIRIGEAAGNLAEMLDYLAESGEEAADDQLELISNIIAPLALLAIGLLIAFLVAAMYLPMFGSYQALGL